MGKTKGAKNHHLSGVPEYLVWNAMKSRCYNKKDPDFINYGARGITVCNKWKRSFPAFLEDMGRCPKGNMLDRENNNGPYSPGNCRWVTPKISANNRRNCRVYRYQNKHQTISQWAEDYNINKGSLRDRLNRGWNIHRALTEPMQKRHLHQNNTQLKNAANRVRTRRMKMAQSLPTINKGVMYAPGDIVLTTEGIPLIFTRKYYDKKSIPDEWKVITVKKGYRAIMNENGEIQEIRED